MSSGKFVQGTTITFLSGLLNLIIGVGISVILARVLGPRDKGIYSLAMLLPSLIVTFGNLGIGPATVYYVARGEYRRQQIMGNNVLLSVVVGSVGILAGLTVIFFLHEKVFPGIPQVYLLLALALIPIEIFFSYVDQVLLGSQHIKEFNYVQILQTVVFLALTALMLLILRAGVIGAILGALITWFVSDILVFHFAKKAAGGVDLKPNKIYLKRAATYGIQAHLANILGFLNYRVDMFLINFFLGPAAVGFYSVGVGLVEKLWMVSQAAGKVLFPRVSAETDEQRLKEFTPLVARTVLWTTAVAAVILALLSRWIVQLLYSETFLPAVSALRALLIGVIAISVGQVLGNDIAGRGLPKLNIYTSMVSAINNIILNLLWIPRYGILGAAWASTVSYTISFLGALFFYCRVSGNQWTKIIFLKRRDLALYLKMVGLLWQWIWDKVKRAS